MNKSTMILRAVFVITFLTASAFAEQRTEVTVKRGKVRAQTGKDAVSVAPGQKAILAGGRPPKLTVDDPLVKDLILLDQWLAAETKAKRIPLRGAGVQIHSVDDDKMWRTANLAESPNRSSQPKNTIRLGPTGILTNPKYYSMDGQELRFDFKKLSRTTGYYTIHFPKPVAPGEKFKGIRVAGWKPSDKGWKTMWQDGKLWYVSCSNGTPNFLNYFRFILPKSAILVDTSRPPVVVDAVDGRTAVTMRNYTGKGADGTCFVAFLWPDRDGTTLADLPPRYRGLRSAHDVASAEEYRQGMTKILAGLEYRDQSTPVRCMLTWCCGIVRQDRDIHAGSIAYFRIGGPEEVKRRSKALEKENWEGTRRSFVDRLTFLGSPPWPEKPEEGYLHPVFFCRPGSMIREDTHAFVYLGGKWYRAGNFGGPWRTDVSVFKKHLERARKK